MDPAAVFQVANLLPVPVWAVWILAPRSTAARTLARAVWPWVILCTAYVVLVVVALRQATTFDPAAFGSLSGVMGLFTSPWMALAGWVHYLCFDLFVGRWIMNDAPDAGYRLVPVLLLTFLFGPAGLLLHLWLRTWLQASEIP